MSSKDNLVRRAPGGVPVGSERSNAGAARLARQIDHQRIASLAYQIYESRHHADGHSDEDWLQAEGAYAIRRSNELAAVRDYSAGNSYRGKASQTRR
jgi:hypothetical protein